jgi:hypothetical protein
VAPIVQCGKHDAPCPACRDCLLAELVNAKGERDDLALRIKTLEGRLARVLRKWASETRDSWNRKAMPGVWTRRHLPVRRKRRAA